MTAPRTAPTAPPWSPQAERSVLSVCMRDVAALEAVMGILGSVDAPFFDENHARFWEGIKALHAAHKPVDLVSVSEAIGMDFERVPYLSDVFMNGSPTTELGNVRHYAGIVFRDAQRRRSIRLSSRAYHCELSGDAELAEATRAELGALTMEPPTAEGLPFVDMGAWEEYADMPLDWLIPGCLMRGEVNTFPGRGGCGKSTFKRVIAMSVCLGRPLLDGLAPVTDGVVFDLSCEDGRIASSHFIGATAKHYGLDREHLSAVLRDKYKMLDNPVPLFDVGKNGAVTPSAMFHALRDEALRLKPTLVCIDTLRKVSGAASGNDAAVMGEIMSALGRLARETNAALMVMCHTSKAGAKSADPDPTNAAGSHAVVSESRHVCELRKTGSDLVMTVVKSNYSQEGTQTKMRFVEAAGSVTLETTGLPVRDINILRGPIVSWFKAHVDVTISPRGVLNNRGAAADLVASVRDEYAWATNADVDEVVRRLLDLGVLGTKTVKGTDRHSKETLELLDEFYEEDPDDMPF